METDSLGRRSHRPLHIFNDHEREEGGGGNIRDRNERDTNLRHAAAAMPMPSPPLQSAIRCSCLSSLSYVLCPSIYPSARIPREIPVIFDQGKRGEKTRARLKYLNVFMVPFCGGEGGNPSRSSAALSGLVAGSGKRG